MALIGVSLLALAGYLLYLKQPGPDETPVQMQKVTQFRHAFEIPSDWYLEKREDFETTSGAKVLIINPEPVTITSVNEGRFYRFNPILVADFSYRADTKDAFRELADKVKEGIQGAEPIDVDVEDAPPGSALIRTEGVGEADFIANKKVLYLLLFLPDPQDPSQGNTYVVDLTTDSQSEFEELKPVAKHIATTLIQPVSP